LIDLTALSVLGEAVDEVPGDGNVLDAVTDRIKKSIPGELWDPFGSLLIGVSEPGAQIRINGRVVGMSPISSLGYLTPGEYKIEAEKEGFQIAFQSVAIERGRETRVELALEEQGGGLSWLVWAGIGLAVIGGATAAAFVLSSGGEDPTFCTAVRPELCP
jgi:hypothetical protein